MKWMVITRVKKHIKYAGHWEPNKQAAIRSAKHFKRKGIPTIITPKPKKRYDF